MNDRLVHREEETTLDDRVLPLLKQAFEDATTIMGRGILEKRGVTIETIHTVLFHAHAGMTPDEYLTSKKSSGRQSQRIRINTGEFRYKEDNPYWQVVKNIVNRTIDESGGIPRDMTAEDYLSTSPSFDNWVLILCRQAFERILRSTIYLSDDDAAAARESLPAHTLSSEIEKIGISPVSLIIESLEKDGLNEKLKVEKNISTVMMLIREKMDTGELLKSIVELEVENDQHIRNGRENIGFTVQYAQALMELFSTPENPLAKPIKAIMRNQITVTRTEDRKVYTWNTQHPSAHEEANLPSQSAPAQPQQ